MANYLIGDIQGCYKELRLLLEKIKFNSIIDTLWFAGDLVARGPDSLAVLKYLMQLGDSVRTVLGNHDLHLLATIAGLKKPKIKDGIQPILESPDLEQIVLWLRKQPLLEIIKLPGRPSIALCHAGISPEWTMSEAVDAAQFATKRLQGKNYLFYLENMYQKHPQHWSEQLNKAEKFCYIVNAFTRMRFCYPDLILELQTKVAPSELKKSDLQPWFHYLPEVMKDQFIAFGHWASLNGEVKNPNLLALDTGCVWGGELTAYRIEDRTTFKQPALN